MALLVVPDLPGLNLKRGKRLIQLAAFALNEEWSRERGRIFVGKL
jgi:hypothetical protein